MARSPDTFKPRPVLAPPPTPSQRPYKFAHPVDTSWTEADRRRDRIRHGLPANRNLDEEMPVKNYSDLGHIDDRLKIMLESVKNGLGFENRYHKLAIYSFVLGANAAVHGNEQLNAEITRLATECLSDRLHHLRAEHCDAIVASELTPDQAVATVSMVLSIWGSKAGIRAVTKARRIQDGYKHTQHKIRPAQLISQLTDALRS
ncbi:MAG: hypothetical protein WC813_04000 [Patescibacteria group bacterium]|jgi:hypothetical protein